MRGALAALALLATGCTAPKAGAVLDLNEVLQKPHHRLESYSFDPTLTLVDRVQDCPPHVLKWMREWDERPDYHSYAPNGVERARITNALTALPPLYDRVLSERLIGVCFIDGMQGSGATEWVVDNDRNVYIYMVINAEVLRHTLSEWVTQKELSCFRPDPQLSLRVDLGGGRSGFSYIMLHEGAHAVDYVRRLTPFTEPVLQQLHAAPGPRERIDGIWTRYAQPVPKYDYPQRTDVTFYGFGDGPKLDLGDAAAVYAALAETPFVSAYASLSWAEDLAELATFYHLCEVAGAACRFVVQRGEKEVASYEPLKNPLVRARAPAVRVLYE